MKHVNLFWAIVWALLAVLALVGIWWNPADIFVVIIAGIFCGMFVHDYIKTKNI